MTIPIPLGRRIGWQSAAGTKARLTTIGDLHPGQYDFRVRTINTLGVASEWETISHKVLGKTALPGNVGAITAVPWEDGATFTWPAVADLDLAGYHVLTGVHWQPSTAYPLGFFVVPTDGTARQYRCVTPGVSNPTEPAWNTNPVADGTAIWAEASGEWAYKNIATPSLVQELTDVEMSVQGWGVVTLRIWVSAFDTSGNISAGVATAAIAVLNQKPYITVGVTFTYGTFTDLAAAIARLPSGGGAIVIKNGVYQMTDEIILPDKNLDITGESQGGVVVRNNPGKDLFVLANRTKIFSFSNFSVESQNVAAASKMVNISGSETAGSFEFRNLKMTMKKNDDFGIFANTPSTVGALVVRQNEMIHVGNISAGNISPIVYAAYPAASTFKGNVLSGGARVSVSGGYIRVAENQFINLLDAGIHISGAHLGLEISSNVLTLGAGNIWRPVGIWLVEVSAVQPAIISDNRITIPDPSSFAAGDVGMAGIYVGAGGTGSPVSVAGNIIDITTTKGMATAGLYVAGTGIGSSLQNNRIKINQTHPSPDRVGIDCIVSFTNISSNNINMVNARVTPPPDIGIRLWGNFNTGQGNLITNAGVQISDNGTNNSINKSAGGTF